MAETTSEYLISFEEKIWDEPTLQLLLDLKIRLSRMKQSGATETKLRIDFSKTKWCEPTSILSLLNVLNNFENYLGAIVVDFGDIERTDRWQFLAFLSRQGFIDGFPQKTKFETQASKKKQFQDYDASDIADTLDDLPVENAFRNQGAIRTKCVDVKRFRNDDEALVQFVEELIIEAKVTTQEYTFQLNPFGRDQFFHRLRKFLFETMLNCVEHAYPDSIGFAAVFARVRRGVPYGEDVGSWHEKFSEELKHAILLGDRELNINSEWIEVYVCDAGDGLLAHGNAWLKCAIDATAREKIKKGLTGKTPLVSMAHFLFKIPLSRYGSNREFRTSETGLLEIARTLNEGGAFMRIVDGNEAFGGQFPWRFPNNASGKRLQRNQSNETTIRLGTCLTLFTQPQTESQSPRSKEFVRPSKTSVERILDEYREVKSLSDNDVYLDRRFSPQVRPTTDEIERASLLIKNHVQANLYVRIPKSATKRDIGHWIDEFNVSNPSAKKNELHVFFLDLKSFHAELLASFISSIATKHSNPIVKSITVCTIGLDAARYAFSRSRYRYDATGTRELATSGTVNPSLQRIVRVLKAMDTSAFWSESAIAPLSTFFIPNKVEWRTSAISDRVLNIAGYADFSQALVDTIRYRTCTRALARIMSLVKPSKVVPTDDLVAPIIRDVESEFSLLAGNEKRELLLGSVEVSGQTIARYGRRTSARDALSVSFLSRSKGGRESKSVDSYVGIALLNWKPPKLEDNGQLYHRVSGTPYVAREGDYSVRVNRFYIDAETSEIRSFYQRNPAETYKDFSSLGALSLSHKESSLRHDLLSLNASSIIAKSAIHNSTLWKWLTRELDERLGNERIAWIVIFPNQPSVNSMVRAYIETSSSRGRLDGRFFPMNFLRKRTIEPYLASPLLEEKLTEFIEKSSLPVKALILDTISFSGRTLRQVTQLVQHCAIQAGSSKVEVISLALVDRSGFPAYQGVVPEFTRKHLRYWKWDVPHLGQHVDCPLCAALDNAKKYSLNSHSRRVSAVVSDWTENWAVVAANESQPDEDVTGIELPEPIEVTFGVLKHGDRTIKHAVIHKNSVGLLSHLVELTRLTHRSDIALKWARKFTISAPLVSLQILSTQLFFFGSTFRYWERFAYFRDLLELLFQLPSDSSKIERRTIGLACLTIFGIDKDLLDDLDELFLQDALGRVEVKNEDVCVAMGRLYVGKKRLLTFEERGSILGRNLHRFQVATNGLSSFADLFEIVGISPTDWHFSKLHAAMNRLQDLKDHSPYDFWNLQGRLRNVVRRIESLLERIQDDIIAADNLVGVSLNPEADHEAMKVLLAEVMRTERRRNVEDAALSFKQIDAFIYNSASGTPGLARRYFEALIRPVKKSDRVSLLLAEVRSEIVAEWNDFVSSKNIVNPQYWRVAELRDEDELSKQLRPPLINCGSDDIWKVDLHIFWTDSIKGAIRDTLQNVVHVEQMCQNPWNTTSTLADLWWNGFLHDGYLEVQFATAYLGAEQFELTAKESYNALVSLGGKAGVLSFSEGIVVQSLRIPVIRALSADTREY